MWFSVCHRLSVCKRVSGGTGVWLDLNLGQVLQIHTPPPLFWRFSETIHNTFIRMTLFHQKIHNEACRRYRHPLSCYMHIQLVVIKTTFLMFVLHSIKIYTNIFEVNVWWCKQSPVQKVFLYVARWRISWWLQSGLGKNMFSLLIPIKNDTFK